MSEISHQPGTRLRVAVDVDEGEQITMCPSEAQPACLPLQLCLVPDMCTAVLGRFVHALNGFVLAKYGMQHKVSDYHVYEFAKVSQAYVVQAVRGCTTGHKSTLVSAPFYVILPQSVNHFASFCIKQEPPMLSLKS